MSDLVLRFALSMRWAMASTQHVSKTYSPTAQRMAVLQGTESPCRLSASCTTPAWTGRRPSMRSSPGRRISIQSPGSSSSGCRMHAVLSTRPFEVAFGSHAGSSVHAVALARTDELGVFAKRTARTSKTPSTRSPSRIRCCICRRRQRAATRGRRFAQRCMSLR